jgi:hypothetical protein
VAQYEFDIQTASTCYVYINHICCNYFYLKYDAAILNLILTRERDAKAHKKIF